MDFLYHTPQTTNNQNISKMSLALTVPKGYKINSKGKLVRRKIIRILRILTSKGLDTDYDGLYGLLPSGVCGIIGEIIVAMRNHEKKVEWDKRLTWSAVDKLADGDRPMSCLGQKLGNYEKLAVRLAAGDVIQAGGDLKRQGWWRVVRKTDKTVQLRKLETELEALDGSNWNSWLIPSNKDDREAWCGIQRGGEIFTTPFLGRKSINLQGVYTRLTGKYSKSNESVRIFPARYLPMGFQNQSRVYKMNGKVGDLTGRWVQGWVMTTVKSLNRAEFPLPYKLP